MASSAPLTYASKVKGAILGDVLGAAVEGQIAEQIIQHHPNV
jgi:ADP-ribosylglycohydrolase